MPIAHISGGLSIVTADVAALMQEHRKRGYLVPYEPKPIQDLSRRMQVYIYNAGPFPQSVSMGSMGTIRIDAVSASQFISMDVSKPAVIPGIPSEVYPPFDQGGIGVRHYYRPNGKNAVEETPGLSMAIEIVAEVERMGVFVSSTNDQGDPEFIEKRDEARLRARSIAIEICHEYDRQYLKRAAKERPFRLAGTVHDPAVMAVVAGRPEDECPWLPVHQISWKD